MIEKCLNCDIDSFCDYCEEDHRESPSCSKCGYCDHCFNYSMEENLSYECTKEGKSIVFGDSVAYCKDCIDCGNIIGGESITNYKLTGEMEKTIRSKVPNDQLLEIIKSLDMLYWDEETTEVYLPILVCSIEGVTELLMAGCNESLFPKEIIARIKSNKVKSGRK